MATPRNSVPESLMNKRRKLQEETVAASTAPVPEPVAGETPPKENPPVAVVVPAEPVVTPPPVIAEPLRETFEAQFKTAQGLLGKAGKDIQDIRDENARLQNQLREQMEMMDTFLKKQNTPPPEPPAPPAQPVPDVERLSDSENDVLAAYEGLEPIFRKISRQEAISVGNTIAQVLREEFTGLVNPVSGKVDTIINTEQKRKASSFETTLNAELNREFPDAQFDCNEIHNNPDFGNWIAGRTDMYGNLYVTRDKGGVYNDALAALDVGIVTHIQKEYIRDRGITAPATPTIPVAPVAPARSTSGIHPDLEDQIVPAQVVSGGVPSTPAPVLPGSLEEVTQAQKAYFANITSPHAAKFKAAYEDARTRFYNSEQNKKLAGKK